MTFVVDSELTSAVQYLNHRSNMPNRHIRELLGIIAAEELGHMELIAVAINKLGGSLLLYTDSQGSPWVVDYIDQSDDPVKMLQWDILAETREADLYEQHLEMTSDLNMKRLMAFLNSREDVHKRLLQKAQSLLGETGSAEEFNELIYDYKVSLQILE